MQKKMNILFLCTGNSCRSQMAEGWGHFLKSEGFNFYSAGTNPKGVHPKAVQVMKEVGVDISAQQSKHLRDFDIKTFDVVITLCGNADENCPVFSGKTLRLHQGFDDPPKCIKEGADEEEELKQFRRVRDEIRAYVEGFRKEMFQK